jgi:signal transduction histidine kinase
VGRGSSTRRASPANAVLAAGAAHYRAYALRPILITQKGAFVRNAFPDERVRRLVRMARSGARGLSWWDGSVRILLLDVALAVGTGLLSQAEVRNPVGVLPLGPATPVVLTIAAGALLVRRRFPLPVCAVASLCFVLTGTVVGPMLAAYTIASRLGNARTMWIGGGCMAAVISVPWGAADLARNIGDLLTRATYTLAFIGVPLLLGLWMAQRRQLIVSLRERAEQAERERDLRAANAVAEERTRIARELHDVVAHRISQIAVLTGAIEATENGSAARVAEAIRGTSTAALEEMRELLGVLRRGAEVVPEPPAPTLLGLGQLVDEAVATGQTVRAVTPEELPSVPGSVGRAIYRLVQESLTNAAKHAPGAEVDLALDVGDGELTVSVSNTPGVPHASRTTPVVESGFGLAGMRERALLVGGDMHVESRPGAGTRVLLTVPLEEVDRASGWKRNGHQRSPSPRPTER